MFDYDPYAFLTPVPSFEVRSDSFTDGSVFAPAQVHAGAHPDGLDLSPALSWSGFPAETRSFVVTMFDPDAPTASGYWHWAVADLPVSTTSLAQGAGTPGSPQLPAGALCLKNDAGFPGYMGSAPPAGHGAHRYMVVVYAVDVQTLELSPDTTAATLGFNLHFHTLARARLTGLFEL
ncbi:YbhB/YbcL family Raf kinase inhibitor-like protein [Arthrobacter psychrochitiniphilus]|uniref:YbhB/YbcL family Raf kinase inhibitor-like protein n=1 Tax=Arthrobacter psychrochitiniphilus TaxID=291045 RepID=UPI003F7C01A9